jgi:cold shock protein
MRTAGVFGWRRRFRQAGQRHYDSRQAATRFGGAMKSVWRRLLLIDMTSFTARDIRVGKARDVHELQRSRFADAASPALLDRGTKRAPSLSSAAALSPSVDSSAGPLSTAVVKWFNPEKGFGFVELADDLGDAFLHGSVLSRAGHSTISPGVSLLVRIGPGKKGRQVTEVLKADASPPLPEPPRREKRADPRIAPRGGDLDPGSTVEIHGGVKWYDPEKGFGFVEADDGGRDVFVHASALQRSGISILLGGQRVRVRVVEGRKGREAASMTITGFA